MEDNSSPGVIGIVTFNNANNFGAFCQEYALQTHLKKSGLQTEVIKIDNEHFDQMYRYNNNILRVKSARKKLHLLKMYIKHNKVMRERVKREHTFEECREREITESSKVTVESLPAIVNDYSCFISGSDQVWNFSLLEGNYAYFLNFVPKTQSYKKLSYAASLNITGTTSEDDEKMAEMLSDFSSILVRERSAKDYLESRLNIQSETVVDPVFFLNREEWDAFAGKSALKKIPEKYLLVYIVATADKLYEEAVNYAEKNNLDVIFLGLKVPVQVKGKNYMPIIQAGPYEFVDLIRNAQALYTTSFHGIAMSIIFEKPFFYERCESANMTRITDLLHDFEIEGRVIGDANQDIPINWENIRKRLDERKSESDRLLMESIKTALDH